MATPLVAGELSRGFRRGIGNHQQGVQVVGGTIDDAVWHFRVGFTDAHGVVLRPSHGLARELIEMVGAVGTERLCLLARQSAFKLHVR